MGFKDYFKDFKCLKVDDNFILRQVIPEKDLESYFEIYSDSDVFKYYAGSDVCKDKNNLMKILNNQINEFEKARVYTWTIAETKTDKAIGRIHLSNFDCNNKIANIGYFINQSFWGKGIISASIKPVVKFGFEYLKLERIHTKVATENVGSWRALEKNGFTREGLLRHCFELKNGLYDCYMYARLYTE